jgi:hypothetical protein
MFRVIQLFDASKIFVMSFGVTVDGCININRQMQLNTVCTKETHQSTVSMKVLLHYAGQIGAACYHLQPHT